MGVPERLTTRHSLGGRVPERAMLTEGEVAPLLYCWRTYWLARRSTGSAVPLKISMTLLLPEPSMYFEMTTPPVGAIPVPL